MCMYFSGSLLCDFLLLNCPGLLLRAGLPPSRLHGRIAQSSFGDRVPETQAPLSCWQPLASIRDISSLVIISSLSSALLLAKAPQASRQTQREKAALEFHSDGFIGGL